MSLFIGDKEKFAIELASNEELGHKVGRLRIWLGDKYIGTFDDASIYSLVLMQLKNVLAKNLDVECLDFDDMVRVYDLIKSEKFDGAARYFLSLGDSFDDFSIVAFCKDGEVFFIWTLMDEHFFEYEDYPTGLQYSIVPVAYFSKVLSGFSRG
ncbi:hypothetical protein [Chitiniphilus eburneus]|uniref:Uncharacterized protein n=1 Tax=Chitiniphilus eburneus TaxID=2571148 RepID=A0A4V5MRT1_9NEIS|nr:hypothetical protein [Chitiniphilus eburneus]TJZ77318.1 hypothetical protein FAZ21_02945 [Chitiniphilus eburneus]